MRQFQQIWLLVSGILIVLIGVLHCLFTSEMYAKLYDELVKAGSLETAQAGATRFAYFFALGGVLAIFCGALMIYAASRLKTPEGWARVVGLASAWLMVLFGVSAMVFGMSNFLIWIMTVAAITSAVWLLVR